MKNPNGSISLRRLFYLRHQSEPPVALVPHFVMHGDIGTPYRSFLREVFCSPLPTSLFLAKCSQVMRFTSLSAASFARPMRRALAFLPFLLAVAVLTTGCDSNGVENEKREPPPQLPPTAFQIDPGLFNQNPTSANSPSTQARKAGTYDNFLAGAARVLPAAATVTAHLAIPAAATTTSLTTTPNFENGSWVWSSTATVQGDDVQFDLISNPDGTEWELRVTYDPSNSEVSLQDFVLFTAETQNGASQGSWQLFYEDDGERAHVLDADFAVEGESDASLTFSVPETAANRPGDSVEYTVDGTTHTFAWNDAQQNEQHLMQWNADTGAGSITSDDYNNGQKACWGPDLKNTACPVLDFGPMTHRQLR